MQEPEYGEIFRGKPTNSQNRKWIRNFDCELFSSPTRYDPHSYFDPLRLPYRCWQTAL